MDKSPVSLPINSMPLKDEGSTVSLSNSPANNQQQDTSKLKRTRSKKLDFKHRTSKLDHSSFALSITEFRGFIVLFWFCLGITLLNLFWRNWREEGTPFRFHLISVFSHDALVFCLSEVAMCSFSLICIPLHWLLMKRWLSVRMSSVVQALVQCGFLYSAIVWTIHRSWQWPQTAVFCLHSISVFMKIHSYLVVNRELEISQRRLNQLLADGKKDRARSSDLKRTSSNGSIVEYSPLTGRIRRISTRQSQNEGLAEIVDDTIDSLKMELTTYNDDGSTNHQCTYPNNVTLWGFIDFLLVPTFVYHLYYPRVEKLRPGYLIEKVVAFVGVFAVLYFMLEHIAYPTLKQMQTSSVVETVLQLIVPFTIGWLMLFFIMFECVGNFAAELTRFADREFYKDWWNSPNYDYFNRTWNKPVHEFLLRHVYMEALHTYGTSKRFAMFITFFLSSLFHELVASTVARKWLAYFFLSQMSQLVIIALMNTPFIKHRPALGNSIFWIAFSLGLPLLTILYTYDHFIHSK